MHKIPKCPECSSEYTYADKDSFVCPECAHEWLQELLTEPNHIVQDANGNVLHDGDTITVIKDLHEKGCSLVIKVGTKIKNIKLVSGDHDITCNIDGAGSIHLKSNFVKKC